MFERSISEVEVRAAIESGEVTETYPNDTPYPSRLVLSVRDGRPIHVVAADVPEGGETIIVTVYQPDPAKWDVGFRRRL